MPSHPVLRIAACAAAVSVLISGRAAAQGLEEVVVTAERRATSLQQTPISVAAFSAESMRMKGIETMEDVASFTPNLDIKGARGSGNVSPTYQIRGLSGGGGATGERSAALYVDGVFMPRTAGPFMNVLDIERVEILRGPQGTLFGRNSTGGAIRVFTRRPGPEQEAFIRLGVGNFDREDLNAMINVPLSDNVSLRATGAYSSQEGYVRRGSQLLGGSEDTLARIQLSIEPNDDLQIGINFSTTESESDGNPQDLNTFDMTPDLNFEGNRADWVSDFLEAAGQPRISPDNDPRIVLDDYTMPSWCFLDDIDPDWDPACEQSNDGEFDQIDMNIAWQLADNVSLTSITGLSEFSSAGITDWVMLGTEMRPSNVESDVIYQELQINSGFANGALDLVAGISYFQEDASSFGVTLDRQGTSSYFAQQGFGNTGLIGSGPNGLLTSADTITAQDSESWGLFANLSWHVTDQLTITPGVRFAFDEKTVTATEFASDNFTPFAGGSTTVVAPYDEDDVDWRLTADYDVNDSVMVYATASKSFRAGAFSLGMDGIREDISGEDQTAQFAAQPPFTPPESVENHEIGVRSEFADGRVRLNLTYFDMNYGDRQAPVQSLDPNSPTGFSIIVVDSGDVDLDGIELDGQVALGDGVALDFSMGLVDSTLSDVCANNGDFLFPGPVEKSYSFGLSGNSMVGAGNNLAWSLAYAWVGKQQTHPGGTNAACPSPAAGWFFDSRYELPDYGLLNGRVTFTARDGRLAVSLFGNNVTDENYATFATRFGGGYWDFVNPNAAGGIGIPERSALGRTMGRPREYGVSLQYNFGAAAGGSGF